MFMLIFTAALNLFWTPGEVVLVKAWVFTITLEGVKRSVFMALRLTFLIIGSSLMTLTTTPNQLTDALEKLLKPLNKIKVPVHEIAMMMSIALRFIPILVDETDKIMKAQKCLKEKEEKFETNKKMVEELYPRFYYLIKNKKLVLEQISNLKRWEEELKDNKIKDAYERLMEQEFEYERRKSRLQENEALLKREERWLHSELVGMNKQRDELINENIEIQRQLYAEIEKNEQVLFIIRSLNSMNPLYEKITKELVASVRGEKTRHIVTSFLKGESIYEIAQREGKSATSVRRMVLLSLMVKTRK